MSKIDFLYDNFVESETEDELIILNIETGEYLGVNGIGREIWNLCKDNNSIENIAETIAQNYDISNEESEKDLMDFLHILSEENLIKIIS